MEADTLYNVWMAESIFAPQIIPKLKDSTSAFMFTLNSSILEELQYSKSITKSLIGFFFARHRSEMSSYWSWVNFLFIYLTPKTPHIYDLKSWAENLSNAMPKSQDVHRYFESEFGWMVFVFVNELPRPVLFVKSFKSNGANCQTVLSANSL